MPHIHENIDFTVAARVSLCALAAKILSQKLGLPLPTSPEKGYNKPMINWSTDEKEFKKKNPQEYKLWRLTQLINYGLDGEKLDRKEVKIAWTKIKDQLDPHKAVYLEYLLWDKKPSSPQFNENFWSFSK